MKHVFDDDDLQLNSDGESIAGSYIGGRFECVISFPIEICE